MYTAIQELFRGEDYSIVEECCLPGKKAQYTNVLKFLLNTREVKIVILAIAPVENLICRVECRPKHAGYDPLKRFMSSEFLEPVAIESGISHLTGQSRIPSLCLRRMIWMAWL